jgi:hypothetical protein
MAKKSQRQQEERLFEEHLVPAEPGSGRLFDVSYSVDRSKPVECMGMTFPNDEARRVYFTDKLREKLKDPVLCDLSPAATFIASVYLNPPDVERFATASQTLITNAQKDLGNLWKTDSGDPVEFQIWTEVFACPCLGETRATDRTSPHP